MFVKHARNKKNLVDVVLVSLHFIEELLTVKSDFGEQFDQQLKHLITAFADITEEPQGLGQSSLLSFSVRDPVLSSTAPH